MLSSKDRDWIQRDALLVQGAWRKGTQWHSSKGLVLYLAGAFGLLAIGGIFFGNNEIGSFGATLSLIVSGAMGGYYLHRQSEEQVDSKRRLQIEDGFKQKGLSLSYDGAKVSDGTNWYDPMSSSSYRAEE